jgi:hypothetical protein
MRRDSIGSALLARRAGPMGPFVHPGSYTVGLTVDDVARERTLDVRLDPRVTIAPEDLRRHTDASLACYRAYAELQTLCDRDRR